MDMQDILNTSPLILAECAISERIRRESDLQLHPELFLTPLIYQERGRSHMTAIYKQYRDVALAAGVPLLLCAPTWRNDRVRLSESGFGEQLLHASISFMQQLCKSWQAASSPIIFGTLLAPAHDCYTPEAALSRGASKQYHSWQISRIAQNRVDCLIAQTIPAVSEALGIGDAASSHHIPYVISFVINSRGEILDGTPLSEAISLIDAAVNMRPLGYMVNCVYPTFVKPELLGDHGRGRLIGIQANSSSLDHSELDSATILHRDDLDHWGKNMLRLNRKWGVRILGGCCGTDHTYLEYLVNQRPEYHSSPSEMV